MFGYFNKNSKKNQAKKHETSKQQHSPVLTEEDEHFLEQIVSNDDSAPPLPERTYLLNPETGSHSGDHRESGKGKKKQTKEGDKKRKSKENSKDKTSRPSLLQRMTSKKVCDPLHGIIQS
jgi:hypothetical protein